eukprot:scaffold5326_cov136-Isochrysis_galbana.AAC.6
MGPVPTIRLSIALLFSRIIDGKGPNNQTSFGLIDNLLESKVSGPGCWLQALLHESEVRAALAAGCWPVLHESEV